MLSWSNTNSTGANATTGIGTLNVQGGLSNWVIFSPTCMNLLQGSTNPNYMINTAERTASTCYMRGFKENLRIQTNSHMPWFHRRICFAWRGIGPFNTQNTADTANVNTFNPYVDTTNGMERLWFNSSINNTPTTLTAQQGILFKGLYNADWNDFIVAPIDTARVDLKFDKTWTIKSGNESGTLVERKLWHPMNKNLTFDDDESGESMSTNYYSVDSKQGMGDYYIVDIFQSGTGGSASDLLNVSSNSTLYWHEK